MSARNTKRSSHQCEVRDLTDWERLRTMTEEEIEAGAASDPDDPLDPGGLQACPCRPGRIGRQAESADLIREDRDSR